jgi:hypothetical protein
MGASEGNPKMNNSMLSKILALTAFAAATTVALAAQAIPRMGATPQEATTDFNLVSISACGGLCGGDSGGGDSGGGDSSCSAGL